MKLPRRIALAAVTLMACIVLAGCGRSASVPSERLTPGPPLPSRPGASVWGVGMPDLVLASEDGGATWTVRHRGTLTNQSTPILWNVSFGDAEHGWAAARSTAVQEATLLVTTDGGTTWKTQRTGASGKLLDVVASDAKHVWALGTSGPTQQPSSLLLATSDGGKTWHQQHVPVRVELSDIAFSDASHGWAVGSNHNRTVSFILSTTDGGQHWRLRHAAKGAILYRLASSDADHCWLVGSGVWGVQPPGIIVATSDGGTHWTTQLSSDRDNFQDIAFVDARNGWAVGSRGTIVATENGGRTWRAQHAGGNYGLMGVAFSDSMHGWALIGHLGLLATENGGRTWTVVTPLGKADDGLFGIACLGPQASK